MIAVLTGVYFIAGKLGLRLAFAHPSATPVWPPTGIALAALLVLGYRVWPAVLLGAFLVNVTTAGSVVTSASIAVGNTLEGVLGTYLINRYAGGCKAFDRVDYVLRFTILGGLVSTTVAATWGVATLALGGYASWAHYGSVWLTWWLGDAVGALFVAPLVILWSVTPTARWKRARIFEAALLLFSIVLVGGIVFGQWLPNQGRSFPVSFLCIPLVTWAACRFGQRETLTGVSVLSAIALWGTLNGWGPFVRGTPNESLLLVQAFVAILVLTGTILAAAIAERKRAEEKFRLVVESTPTGIVMVRRDGTIALVNSQTERLFGYDRGELIGGPIEMLVPARSRGEHRTSRKEFHAEPQARPMGAGRDLRGVRKDGSEFPVEIGLNPVETEGGTLVLGSITDITERQRAEEAVRASELRYRQIFEQNVAGVFRGTIDGRTIECNEALARIFGYASPQEFLSQNAHSLYFSPEERAAAVAALKEKKVLTNLELRLRRKDGTPVWVLLNSALVEGAGESPVIATTALDITDRKRAEEALQKAHDELELQVEQRTEQLSKVVDALRAEIGEREQAQNSLRLLSARLLKLQDEERRRIARELHDSTGQKAAALAIDLSVVATEAEALGPRTRRALAESSNLAEQIVREVRTLSYLLHPPMLDEVGLGSAIRWYADGVAQRGGLVIDLQVPDKLRRMPAEVETALFRIVQESLTNTLLHSGSKRAQVHITQDNGTVMLEVMDDGRGIPVELLNHPEAILERLGVGIAGMRERMKQLGGNLEIQSGSRGTLVRAVVPVGGTT